MTHLCRGSPCRNTSRTEKPRMNSHSCTSTQPHCYTTTQVHRMRKPKPNYLAAALKEQAIGIDPEAAVTSERTQPPARNGPTRQGRVMVSGWLPIEARSSFKLIQAKHPQKPMQDLGNHALNELFSKYNEP